MISSLLCNTSRMGNRDYETKEESKSDDDEVEKESTRSDSPLACSGAEASSQRAESEATDDDSEEVLDPREKFLIFTMGSRTYTPHQIGLVVISRLLSIGNQFVFFPFRFKTNISVYIL